MEFYLNVTDVSIDFINIIFLAVVYMCIIKDICATLLNF